VTGKDSIPSAHCRRVTVGRDVHGPDGAHYGLMLVLFIIYMPKGILGKILELHSRRGPGTPPGRLRPASEAAD
jgi:branched-chain amino acid transport system permease protein